MPKSCAPTRRNSARSSRTNRARADMAVTLERPLRSAPVTDPSRGSSVDIGIYVPQLALGYDGILARARLCEELGFSLWLFDHLYGPELPETPAFEGWTLA